MAFFIAHSASECKEVDFVIIYFLFDLNIYWLYKLCCTIMTTTILNVVYSSIDIFYLDVCNQNGG